MRTVGEAWDSGQNNFDALRLGAALSVMYSHAFYLLNKNNFDEPLAQSTGLPLGWHAVQIFFILSGFLILASYERRKSLSSFLSARVARIMPGLIGVTLFAAFLIGPLVTTLPLSSYLDPVAIVKFMLTTIVTFETEVALPGVFTTLPSNEALGTVWTLKYEVLCYLGVALAGILTLTNRSLFYVAGALGLLGLGWFLSGHPDWIERIPPLQHLLRLGGCFLLGMIGWHWRHRIPLHFGLVIILFGAAWGLHGTSAYYPAVYAFQAYAVLWLGFLAIPRVPALRMKFDYSYGIYLYGFPIQQTFRLWYSDVSIWLTLSASIALTLIAASISWHFIEKPWIQMKYKRIFKSEPATVPAE